MAPLFSRHTSYYVHVTWTTKHNSLLLGELLLCHTHTSQDRTCKGLANTAASGGFGVQV